MATDSSVAITAGAGTPIDAVVLTGGDYQQVVRQARADAATLNSWTVATTAATSQIAADIARVGLLIVSAATGGRVWLRMDATAPTSTAFSMYLDPGDVWEVPESMSCLAVSMLGQTAGGTVLSTLTTKA